jgi:hypothetical protein
LLAQKSQIHDFTNEIYAELLHTNYPSGLSQLISESFWIPLQKLESLVRVFCSTDGFNMEEIGGQQLHGNESWIWFLKGVQFLNEVLLDQNDDDCELNNEYHLSFEE